MKKTIRITYHMRLGDVVRCLPIARYFYERGHKVELECSPEYHGVQDLVSYVMLVPPHHKRKRGTRVLDLQIWPKRADDFEASGKTWQEYIPTLFPEGPRIDFNSILFDKLPPTPDRITEEALCFPQGYSQRFSHHPGVIFHVAHQLYKGIPVVAMGPSYHMEESIFKYAQRIQRARYVLTINSSASIFASAVRASWHHVVSRHPNEEWHDPRQIRISIKLTGKKHCAIKWTGKNHRKSTSLRAPASSFGGTRRRLKATAPAPGAASSRRTFHPRARAI